MNKTTDVDTEKIKHLLTSHKNYRCIGNEKDDKD